MKMASVINITSTADITTASIPTAANQQYDQSYARAVFAMLILIMGVVFNLFILCAILGNRRLYTMNNLMLCHLAGLGVLYCMLILPVSINTMVQGRWVDGQSMCVLYGYVVSLWTVLTVWTITALALDKYHTVTLPFGLAVTGIFRKLTLSLLTMWVVGFVLTFLTLLNNDSPYFFKYAYASCVIDYTHTNYTFHTSIFVCSSFYLPCVIMIYCYAHIFRITHQRNRRIANIANVMTLGMRIPMQVSQKKPIIVPATQLTFRGRKASWTIFHFLFSFIICYLPIAVIITYNVSTGYDVMDVYVTMAITLFQASPCLNAIIYGLSNRNLRESFGNFIHRKISEYSCNFRKEVSVMPNNSVKSPDILNIHDKHEKQKRSASLITIKPDSFTQVSPVRPVYFVRSKSLNFEPMRPRIQSIYHVDAPPIRVWEPVR